MDYQVNLSIFRGPLDLLLHLVKHNEVDICDIPIAKIAEQFVEYLGVLQMVDVEHAGDFLVMAATLMEIKSKMLLPRNLALQAEDADPRQELVKQLLEYKQFKDAAQLLELQEERQLSRVSRVPMEVPGTPDPAEQPLRTVELWDLVSAFGRLMRETLALAPQQIVVDDTPMQVYQDQILRQLKRAGRLPFSSVFIGLRSRARLVGLFLAILELIKATQILAEQDREFGEIWLGHVG
jgi:segregation and condensation protein A